MTEPKKLKLTEKEVLEIRANNIPDEGQAHYRLTRGQVRELLCDTILKLQRLRYKDAEVIEKLWDRVFCATCNTVDDNPDCEPCKGCDANFDKEERMVFWGSWTGNKADKELLKEVEALADYDKGSAARRDEPVIPGHTDKIIPNSGESNLGGERESIPATPQPSDKCKTCDGKKRVPDGTESDLGFGTEYHPTPNYMDCPDCTGKKGGGDG